MDLNSVTLVGRAGKAPELRETKGGTVLAELGLANSAWKKVGDKWEEETSWFDVTVFGDAAKRAAERIKKGHRVGVIGTLKQRRWEAEDGTKREKISIQAKNIQFLEKADKPVESNRTDNEAAPF